MESMEGVGRVIKYMRRRARLKQTDLIQEVGLKLGQSTISGYESEQNSPNFDVVERIANACDFDVVFIDRRNKEIITTKNIARKDIPNLSDPK